MMAYLTGSSSISLPTRLKKEKNKKEQQFLRSVYSSTLLCQFEGDGTSSSSSKADDGAQDQDFMMDDYSNIDVPYSEASEMYYEDEDEEDNTCFKNAVCNVTSNLEIDLEKFTNFFHGQRTGSLPANRNVAIIDNKRYSYLTYKTGKIMLINFIINKSLNKVFDFFNSLFITCLEMGIAKIVPSANDSSTNTLRISFLIENLHFSIWIKQISLLSNSEYADCIRSISNTIKTFGIEKIIIDFVQDLDKACQLIDFYRSLPSSDNTITIIDKLSHFCQNYDGLNKLLNWSSNKTKEMIAQLNEFLSSLVIDCDSSIFPASIVKFIFFRQTTNDLYHLKSDASKKRHKNDKFVRQRCSMHIFNDGKIILTGSQTREDLENVSNILMLLMSYFFNNCT